MMKNRLYDTVNDPTAKRAEHVLEMRELRKLPLKERMNMLSSLGVCSYNWAEKLRA